jgi:hypothetical protein
MEYGSLSTHFFREGAVPTAHLQERVQAFHTSYLRSATRTVVDAGRASARGRGDAVFVLINCACDPRQIVLQ